MQDEQNPYHASDQPDDLDMGVWLTPKPTPGSAPTPAQPQSDAPLYPQTPAQSDTPQPPREAQIYTDPPGVASPAAHGTLYAHSPQPAAPPPPALPDAAFINPKLFAGVAIAFATALILAGVYGIQDSARSSPGLSELAQENARIKERNLEIEKQYNPFWWRKSGNVGLTRAMAMQTARQLMREHAQMATAMSARANAQALRTQMVQERIENGEDPPTEEEMAAFTRQMSDIADMRTNPQRAMMPIPPAPTVTGMFGEPSVPEGALEKTFDDRQFESAAVAGSRVPVLVGVILCVAGLLVWKYHTIKNLPALGAEDKALSPTPSILMWAVPLMNLVAPLVAMQEVARSSRPCNLHMQFNDRQGRLALLAGWWACVVTGVIVFLWSWSKMSGSTGPESMLSAAWFNIFADLVVVGTGALTILVVCQITKDQLQRREMLLAWAAEPAAQQQASGTQSASQPPAGGLQAVAQPAPTGQRAPVPAPDPVFAGTMTEDIGPPVGPLR
jgi:hypothetical protein